MDEIFSSLNDSTYDTFQSIEYPNTMLRSFIYTLLQDGSIAMQSRMEFLEANFINEILEVRDRLAGENFHCKIEIGVTFTITPIQ
ncbi:MAG TPA: hypothetical protein VG603_11700 [Chitinophagales bacterium]|nr:hypothetical protein [Chitinophagales bacterium]